LKTYGTAFYVEGMEKFILKYNMGLNLQGHYSHTYVLSILKIQQNTSWYVPHKFIFWHSLASVSEPFNRNSILSTNVHLLNQVIYTSQPKSFLSKLWGQEGLFSHSNTGKLLVSEVLQISKNSHTAAQSHDSWT
jgi:hypothetical protein